MRVKGFRSDGLARAWTISGSRPIGRGDPLDRDRCPSHLSGALATRSVAPTSLAVGPVSGVYVNGHSGVPHYYVTLENRGNGVVRGSMDYLYQDGQTSVIFTFNGWSEKFGSHGTTGSLTLSTIKVKDSLQFRMALQWYRQPFLRSTARSNSFLESVRSTLKCCHSPRATLR